LRVQKLHTIIYIIISTNIRIKRITKDLDKVKENANYQKVIVNIVNINALSHQKIKIKIK
jgi:hypothetical protein